MCLFYLYVRTYVPVVLAGRALPVCACSLCCGYVRTYGDAPTMMIECLAMMLPTVVTTMLTTLVPTTVVRTARTTTMCFEAFHSVATLATFHEQNFTSAWLKAC